MAQDVAVHYAYAVGLAEGDEAQQDIANTTRRHALTEVIDKSDKSGIEGLIAKASGTIKDADAEKKQADAEQHEANQSIAKSIELMKHVKAEKEAASRANEVASENKTVARTNERASQEHV